MFFFVILSGGCRYFVASLEIHPLVNVLEAFFSMLLLGRYVACGLSAIIAYGYSLPMLTFLRRK